MVQTAPQLLSQLKRIHPEISLQGITSLAYGKCAPFEVITPRKTYYLYDPIQVENLQRNFPQDFSMRRMPLIERSLTERYLSVHSLPKKSGGWRQVVEYGGKLKEFLSALKLLLTKRIEKDLPAYMVGCRTGVSLPEIGRSMSDLINKDTYVLGFDIRNWFNSIKTSPIEQFLEKYFSTKGSLNLCNAIAEICTYRGCLTQGSPLSALFANGILVDEMGKEIEAIINKHCIDAFIYVDNVYIIYNGKDKQKALDIMAEFREIFHTRGYQTHKDHLMYTKHPKKAIRVLGQTLDYFPGKSNRTNHLQKRHLMATLINLSRDKFAGTIKFYNLSPNLVRHYFDSPASNIGRTFPEYDPDKFYDVYKSDPKFRGVANGYLRQYLQGQIAWFSSLEPEFGEKHLKPLFNRIYK